MGTGVAVGGTGDAVGGNAAAAAGVGVRAARRATTGVGVGDETGVMLVVLLASACSSLPRSSLARLDAAAECSGSAETLSAWEDGLRSTNPASPPT